MNLLFERPPERSNEVLLHLRAGACVDAAFAAAHIELRCAAPRAPLRLDFGRARLEPAQCAVRGATLRIALQRGSAAALRRPRANAAGELVASGALARLACRQCRAALSAGNAPLRTLPLPSPGWLELSDAWHCRCACSGPERPAHKPIGAQRGLCLADAVLGTLLLRGDALRDGALRQSARAVRHCFGLPLPPALYDANNALECAQCGSTLGYAAALGADADVRLFARALAAADTAGETFLRSFSLESDVANDLHFHVHQTRQRRFVVQRLPPVDADKDAKDSDADDDIEGDAAVFVLVLDPEWLAFDQTVNDDATTVSLAGTLQPHCKVLFREYTAGSMDDAFELERWQHKLGAQMLVYDDNVCDELLAVLKRSNKRFPANMQKVDDMQSGFLKRIAF